MAAKSIADLQIEQVAAVESQTAPDSIKPTTIDVLFKDIIDSYWNKIDGITVGTIASPLLIPAAFQGIIDSGDPLQKIIQAVLNNANTLYQINSAMLPQGRPGLFLASDDAVLKQIVNLRGTPSTDIVAPNDGVNGSFDNGNNWSTFDYRNLSAPFSGKFFLSGIALELISAPDTLDYSLRLEIQNEAGTALATGQAFTIATTDTPGQLYYPNDIATSTVTVAQTTGIVKVVLKALSGSNICRFKVNSIRFRNED